MTYIKSFACLVICGHCRDHPLRALCLDQKLVEHFGRKSVQDQTIAGA